MQKHNFMILWKVNIAKFITKQLTQLSTPYETVSIKIDTKLRNIVLKAIRNESFEQEFDFVTNLFGADLKTTNLRTQLGISGIKDI